MDESHKANGAGAAPPVLVEEPQSEPPSQPISIRIPHEMLEQLKVAAAHQGLASYQRFIKHILANWLRDNAERPAAPRAPVVVPWPRTRLQLREALAIAVKRQEEALARGAAEEARTLDEEIEVLRDELADLDDQGV